MGNGGMSFQAPAWPGVLCLTLLAACRSGRADAELRSLRLEYAGDPSLVVGHRFGNWLEVEPEPAARPVLENACLMEQVGETENAIEALGDELESGSACASVFEARGALYLADGFPRAAAGDFQRAVALSPERPRSWYALGHAYECLGLTRQALESLEHARTLGGEDAGLYLSLARVYRSLGRNGLAARHYERAIERLAEPSTEILAEVAVLATEDGDRAAKVTALRDRLESCRGTTLTNDGWFLRALLRELAGEKPQDVVAAFQALEVAPQELRALAQALSLALELLDPETSADARAGLLADEPDLARRSALERCLAAP